MKTVNVGIIGLGNVGSGALSILSENRDQIATKLGFPLNVKAVCARTPEPFYAVGLWYQDFTQTTDQEVRDLLERAAEQPVAAHQET